MGRPRTSDAERAAVEECRAALAERPDGLFADNVVEPGKGVVLAREGPHHRLFVELRSRGISVADIANATGYSPATIRYTLRQPWARKRLLDALEQDGDTLRTLLHAECLPSFEKLVELRDSEDVQHRVQLAAANSLLDRFLGKPTQKVEVEESMVNTADIEALNREAEAAKAEVERLLGKN